MVIRIADLVTSCDTTQQGEVVLATLRKSFTINGPVTVSFAGIGTATSSFVNAALVDLMDSVPFSDIKARLKIVDSSRQINEMIRHRLTTEAARARVAA